MKLYLQAQQWNDVINHSVKSGKYLQCPLCQERHEVPKEGVEGFRKNFYVSSLKSAGFGNSFKVRGISFCKGERVISY